MSRNPRMRKLFSAVSAVIKGDIRRTTGFLVPEWV
jgi:hypothetical protein